MKINGTYRLLSALTFFTAFLLQTFNRPFVVADYYANTQAYAKNCVNKVKPKLQCNGKCQMMKKLQQEEKKDQQNPDRKAENKNEVLLYAKCFPVAVLRPVTLLNDDAVVGFIVDNYTFNHSSFMLRPPIAA